MKFNYINGMYENVVIFKILVIKILLLDYGIIFEVNVLFIFELCVNI